jgi:hypothetical protein
LEEVLAEKEFAQKKPKEGDLIQIPYERGIIELQMTSALTAKIVRLHTYVLDDYLHPSFQPGMEIKLKYFISP